jgi:hypothetical protein
MRENCDAVAVVGIMITNAIVSLHHGSVGWRLHAQQKLNRGRLVFADRELIELKRF